MKAKIEVRTNDGKDTLFSVDTETGVRKCSLHVKDYLRVMAEVVKETNNQPQWNFTKRTWDLTPHPIEVSLDTDNCWELTKRVVQDMANVITANDSDLGGLMIVSAD